jgi:hypothetical protein
MCVPRRHRGRYSAASMSPWSHSLLSCLDSRHRNLSVTLRYHNLNFILLTPVFETFKTKCMKQRFQIQEAKRVLHAYVCVSYVMNSVYYQNYACHDVLTTLPRPRQFCLGFTTGLERTATPTSVQSI